MQIACLHKKLNCGGSKLSNSNISCSDQSKAKISSGLKKSWEKRLKHRRSQENCCIIWSGSIAEAARRGGYDQGELNWDSYERIKADIDFQHIQQKAVKARAREIARLREGRVSQIRVENVAGLAKQRNDNEKKAEAKKAEASSWKRSEDEKKKTALSEGFKLKARLVKVILQMLSILLHFKIPVCGCCPVFQFAAIA